MRDDWLPTKTELGAFAADWAISCELQAALVELLERRQPKTILELGAGVSTLIFQRYCRDTKARLVSLEQSQAVADHVLRLLAAANLSTREVSAVGLGPSGFYPETANAPKSDLVLIDGPRGTSGRSCAAAMDFYGKVITAETCVVVDDTNRRQLADVAECIQRDRLAANTIRRTINDQTFRNRGSLILEPPSG